MSATALNVILAVAWVFLQAAILWYYVPAFLITRRAFATLSGNGSNPSNYVYRVALDRLRAQRWRLAAIAGYMTIGFAAAIPLPALRLAVGPVLFFGELVLLRNARADALLVRDIARHLFDDELSSPGGDTPAAPRAPGHEPAIAGDE